MGSLSKRLIIGASLLIFLTGALFLLLHQTGEPQEPAANDRPAIPTHSNPSADEGKVSGAVPPVINEEPQSPQQIAFSNTLEDWAAQIRESEIPEHILAAALLEKDSRIGFLRLQRLLQENPWHPLLNMTLADHCLELPDPLFCNEQLRHRLMSFDGDNGRVRDLLALLAWQKGDPETALYELRESARSSYSDDLWADQLQIVGESLTSFGLQERNQQWQEGVFGYVAATTARSLSQIVTLCREQITNPEWRSTCRARGLNLAENGRTLLLQSLGLGLARIASDADDPVISRTKAHLDQTQARMIAIFDQLNLNSDKPRASLNDVQWQKFLDIMRSEGEAAGLEYLTQTLAEL